jgi:hypothetical protein
MKSTNGSEINARAREWKCYFGTAPRRVIKLSAVLLANRRMMRTTSQLMVYLEPVTMKTPFGPAKPARKKARRRDIYAKCR